VDLAEIEGQCCITPCMACWCCKGVSVIRWPDGPCRDYPLREVICVCSVLGVFIPLGYVVVLLSQGIEEKIVCSGSVTVSLEFLCRGTYWSVCLLL